MLRKAVLLINLAAGIIFLYTGCIDVVCYTFFYAIEQRHLTVSIRNINHFLYLQTPEVPALNKLVTSVDVRAGI